MDKINETLTWLMLAIFGYWFTTNKTMPAGDQSTPEVAPAAGPDTPEATGMISERTEKPCDMAFGEGSLITFNLSEMMGQRKARRNLRRRKEDQISS